MHNASPFVPGILPTLGAIAANRMPARRYTNDDLNYAKSWTPKAAHGLVASGFSSGGKWEVVKEFKGKSHKEGGIDIEIKDGRIIRSSGIEPEYIAGGGFWKDLGAGAYGLLEGTLDTVTMGATDQLTDWGYKALQDVGGSTASEKREQDSIRGYGQAGGAILGAVSTGGATTGSAISTGASGLGEGISKGNESEEWAQYVGTGLKVGGQIAGLAVGNAGFAKGAKAASDATKAGETVSKAAKTGADWGKTGRVLNTLGKAAPYINTGVSVSRQLLQKPTPMQGIPLMSSIPSLGIDVRGMEKSSRFPTSPGKLTALPKPKSSLAIGSPFGFGKIENPPLLPANLTPMVAEGRRAPMYDASYANHLRKYKVNSYA